MKTLIVYMYGEERVTMHVCSDSIFRDRLVNCHNNYLGLDNPPEIDKDLIWLSNVIDEYFPQIFDSEVDGPPPSIDCNCVIITGVVL